MTTQKDLKQLFMRIFVMTDEDMLNKNIFELFASATEELGELARELLVEEGSFGNNYKEVDEGTKAEAVDLAISALAIFYARGGNVKFFIEKANEKLDKWEKNQANEK